MSAHQLYKQRKGNTPMINQMVSKQTHCKKWKHIPLTHNKTASTNCTTIPQHAGACQHGRGGFPPQQHHVSHSDASHRLRIPTTSKSFDCGEIPHKTATVTSSYPSTHTHMCSPAHRAHLVRRPSGGGQCRRINFTSNVRETHQ